MFDTIIDLEVRNHPGVMSQITGLFSRRAFNLEGIVCAPKGDRSRSRMILMVYKDKRITQVLKQLEKLYDVLTVSVRPASSDPVLSEQVQHWVCNDPCLSRSGETRLRC